MIPSISDLVRDREFSPYNVVDQNGLGFWNTIPTRARSHWRVYILAVQG